MHTSFPLYAKHLTTTSKHRTLDASMSDFEFTPIHDCATYVDNVFQLIGGSWWSVDESYQVFCQSTAFQAPDEAVVSVEKVEGFLWVVFMLGFTPLRIQSACLVHAPADKGQLEH